MVRFKKAKSKIAKLMAFVLTFMVIFQLSFISEAKTPSTKSSFTAQTSNTYTKSNQLGYDIKYNEKGNIDLQNYFKPLSLTVEAICSLYGTHRMVADGCVDIYSGNSVYTTLRYAGWMIFKCDCGENICVQSDAFMYSTAPIGYYLVGVTILAGNDEMTFAQSTASPSYCSKNYMSGFTFKYAS